MVKHYIGRDLSDELWAIFNNPFLFLLFIFEVYIFEKQFFNNYFMKQNSTCSSFLYLCDEVNDGVYVLWRNG